jgi:hypothetical protein
VRAIRIRHRGRLVATALGIFVPLALAGCSSSPAALTKSSTTTTTTTTVPTTTTSTTAAAVGPPCTSAAITAGIQASPNNDLISVNGFGCSGPWAWAGVTLGTSSQNSFDAVMVLMASGPAWAVTDRATACNQHLVPADIYNDACTTS